MKHFSIVSLFVLIVGVVSGRAGPITTNGTLRLTWTNPAGSSAVGLRVEASVGNSNNFAAVASLPPTASVYTPSGLLPSNTYFYRVVATNGTASAASNIASGTPAPPPAIMAQPASAAGAIGQTVNFSVTAASAGVVPVSYQWYGAGTAISGATAASLSVTVSATSAQSYYVIVSGGGGTNQSDPAMLTIVGLPPVTGLTATP